MAGLQVAEAWPGRPIPQGRTRRPVAAGISGQSAGRRGAVADPAHEQDRINERHQDDLSRWTAGESVVRARSTGPSQDQGRSWSTARWPAPGATATATTEWRSPPSRAWHPRSAPRPRRAPISSPRPPATVSRRSPGSEHWPKQPFDHEVFPVSVPNCPCPGARFAAGPERAGRLARTGAPSDIENVAQNTERASP